MLDTNFNKDLVNRVEEIIKSYDNQRDRCCLNVLDIYFEQENFWVHPEIDLVFLFVKIYPQTFRYNLPKTRYWLTRKCFDELDPISQEVLKQFFNINPTEHE